MNRLTTAPIIGGLITIAVLIAVIVGCSDDVLVPDLPSLLGNYEGVYRYTENLGSSNEQSDLYQITWRFSDRNFWLSDNIDSSEGRCICEPSGEYILADGVEIVTREEGCASCVFDGEKLPDGVFSLRQPTNPNTGLDSIVMTQIIDDVRKEIRLVPTD